MNTRTVALAAIAVVAAISAVATYQPRAFSFLRYVPFGDKFGHFFIFGLLSLALVSAIRNQRATSVGIAMASLIVIVEEGLQIFSSTRSFSISDLAASLTGVFVFALGAHFVRNRGST